MASGTQETFRVRRLTSLLLQRSEQETRPKSPKGSFGQNAHVCLPPHMLVFRRNVNGRSADEINTRWVSPHTAPGDFGGPDTKATSTAKEKKECHSERSEESENSEWKAFERKRQSALLGRIVIRPYESSRFEALPFPCAKRRWAPLRRMRYVSTSTYFETLPFPCAKRRWALSSVVAWYVRTRAHILRSRVLSSAHLVGARSMPAERARRSLLRDSHRASEPEKTKNQLRLRCNLTIILG